MQNYMLSTPPVQNEEGFGNEKQIELGNDHATRQFRSLIQEKKEEAHHKKMLSFLYAASSLLVMVIMIIGITMLNNYEKMENMEHALTELSGQVEDGFAAEAKKNEQTVQENDTNQVVEAANMTDDEKQKLNDVTAMDEAQTDSEAKTPDKKKTEAIDNTQKTDGTSNIADEKETGSASGTANGQAAESTANTDNEKETGGASGTDGGQQTGNTANADNGKETGSTANTDSGQTTGSTANTDNGKETGSASNTDNGQATGSTANTDSGQTTSSTANTDSGQVTDVSKTSKNYTVYEVKKGDTLAKISIRFYGTDAKVADICALNHILDQDTILYGTKILLP